jgi:hypothetical protein
MAGALFGHIHRDGFMMLEVEERGTPVNLNTFLVNSALSPREKQNPSFRAVQYRHRAASRARQEHGTNANVGLQSFSVRYLNLTEVYASPKGTVPEWRMEYDFANAYGASSRAQPNSLLPPDVQRVVHDIFEVCSLPRTVQEPLCLSLPRSLLPLSPHRVGCRQPPCTCSSMAHF